MMLVLVLVRVVRAYHTYTSLCPRDSKLSTMDMSIDLLVVSIIVLLVALRVLLPGVGLNICSTWFAYESLALCMRERDTPSHD